MRKIENNEVAIIIYSCYKNSDMWRVFSILFSKYWKDCPYKIILVTDKKEEDMSSYVFDETVVIDDSWAHMIKGAVRAAGTPYIMLWMDDYLICNYVQNEDIDKYIKVIKKHHAANLRLIESPTSVGCFKDNRTLGYYQPGSAYCLSTQIGIWDSEFLMGFIQDDWSAWDYERIGSMEAKNISQPILITLDYTFPYEEGVRKGKWIEQGVRLCKRNGIIIDTSRRAIMTNWDMAKIYLKGVILDVNLNKVVSIQNFFHKVFHRHRKR